MTFWEKLKNWFGIGAGAGKRLCIVDAATLSGSGKSNGRLNPKEQIQILRKLSQFAEREGIDVAAVFEGHALREVAHGESFGARVKVYFADSSAGVQDVIRKLVADERARKPLVVTANRKFEEELSASGAFLLRGNTFRKGIDLALYGGGEQAAQGNGQQRANERRRRRSRKQQNAGQAQSPAPDVQRNEQNGTPAADGATSSSVTPNTATPAGETSGERQPTDVAIRSLIDLVE